MRRPGILVLLLAALLSPAWMPLAAGEDRFVAGIDDLPLMAGLAPVAGQNVVFDAPGGRVVEAWAQGSVTRESVLSFYGSTLPQLGWTVAAPDLFRRDGETLRLEFPPGAAQGGATAAAGALLIRFYLSPG
ncbi:MAG: hypothetical protein JO128_00055 [Alphaproteobacteria bacterium]|nr:hypothetical protein [Alphaproteobacteria bacterium]